MVYHEPNSTFAPCNVVQDVSVFVREGRHASAPHLPVLSLLLEMVHKELDLLDKSLPHQRGLR